MFETLVKIEACLKHRGKEASPRCQKKGAAFVGSDFVLRKRPLRARKLPWCGAGHSGVVPGVIKPRLGGLCVCVCEPVMLETVVKFEANPKVRVP